MLKQWFYVKDGKKIYSSQGGVVLAVLDSKNKYSYGYDLPKIRKGKIPKHFANYKRILTISEKLKKCGIKDEIIKNMKFSNKAYGYNVYYSEINEDEYTIILRGNEPFAIIKNTFIVKEYRGLALGYESCMDYGDAGEVIDITTGREVFCGYVIDDYVRLDN